MHKSVFSISLRPRPTSSRRVHNYEANAKAFSNYCISYLGLCTPATCQTRLISLSGWRPDRVCLPFQTVKFTLSTVECIICIGQVYLYLYCAYTISIGAYTSTYTNTYTNIGSYNPARYTLGRIVYIPARSPEVARGVMVSTAVRVRVGARAGNIFVLKSDKHLCLALTAWVLRISLCTDIAHEK